MSTPYAQPANWYPDPAGGHFLRYWDGGVWTTLTRPMLAQAAPALTMYPGTPAANPLVLYPQSSFHMPPPTGAWRSPIDSRPVVRNMVDAVRVCAQKYAQFDGRASCPEFWYATLACVLLTFVLTILAV